MYVDISKLLFAGGAKTTHLWVAWFVGLALIGLYCWLSYVLVDETAFFTTALYDFSNLAFNASLPEDVDALNEARRHFKDDFLERTWIVALKLTVTSFIYSLFIAVSHHIAEINREHLTSAMMAEYLSGNIFYLVNSNNREIDNLQARFTTDVKQVQCNVHSTRQKTKRQKQKRT